MTKRCGRCRQFLGGHKRFCLKCKRIINKADRMYNELVRTGKIDSMPLPKQEPEVYQGKKEKCGYCGTAKPLKTIKKFTLDGKTLRDKAQACDTCKDGFFKRLGYQ